MPRDKGTNIFLEIGKFFKENDATSAMNAIMDMTKNLRNYIKSSSLPLYLFGCILWLVLMS